MFWFYRDTTWGRQTASGLSFTRKSVSESDKRVREKRVVRAPVLPATVNE